MSDASPVLPTPPSHTEIKTRNAQRHELLRRLDSKQKSISAQAIDECRNLTALEIRALLRMAEEPKNPHLPQRTQWWIAIMILVGLMFFLSLILYLKSETIFIIAIYSVSILYVILSCYVDKQKHYSERVRDNLAVVISNTQDPDLLPEALRVLNHIRPVYYNNLTPLKQALLDKAAAFLQELDIEQIRSYRLQQQALCLFLEPDVRHKMPHTAIRILNYLEQYGTSIALFQVSCIANAKLSRREYAKVRDAAQTCLAALEQRARESSQSQVLLRAADAPATAPDALLRPAEAQASHPEPNTLLRPAAPIQSSPSFSGKIINGNTKTS